VDSDTNISWNSQLERIISDEGERSLCYSWLHSKSEKYYTKLSTYITLPVIILSTIAGAGSIGVDSLFNGSPIASIMIGTISLSVATLNTVASFFSWAKRSEAHRIASTTYTKVYRFILIELALPRSERIAAKDMLKIVRDQCDRLAETSPQIPDIVIEDFKKHFGSTTPDVKKPEITNGLDPIYVHPPDVESPHYRTARMKQLEAHMLSEYVEGKHPREAVRISISDHIRDMSQKSSSVHPLNESASDSSRILTSFCIQSNTDKWMHRPCLNIVSSPLR